MNKPHFEKSDFTAADLIALVIPSPMGDGVFQIYSPAGGTPRIYGGQYLAQAIMAAGQMVEPSRVLHQLSGQFIAPGRIDLPAKIMVTPLRKGRSFSVFRVDFLQQGTLLFTANLSFHAPDPGRALLSAGPPLPAPEGWITEAEYLAHAGQGPEAGPQISPGFFSGLIERRSRSWRDETQDMPAPAQTSYWLKLREQLKDHAGVFAPSLTPLLHHALIAYFSDLNLLATGARPLGFGARHPLTRSASLSHTMYFHAAHPVDDWYFTAISGLGVNQGRAAAIARIYSQDGDAVITATQEGLVRRLAQAPQH